MKRDIGGTLANALKRWQTSQQRLLSVLCDANTTSDAVTDTGAVRGAVTYISGISDLRNPGVNRSADPQ